MQVKFIVTRNDRILFRLLDQGQNAESPGEEKNSDRKGFVTVDELFITSYIKHVIERHECQLSNYIFNPYNAVDILLHRPTACTASTRPRLSHVEMGFYIYHGYYP